MKVSVSRVLDECAITLRTFADDNYLTGSKHHQELFRVSELIEAAATKLRDLVVAFAVAFAAGFVTAIITRASCS